RHEVRGIRRTDWICEAGGNWDALVDWLRADGGDWRAAIVWIFGTKRVAVILNILVAGTIALAADNDALQECVGVVHAAHAGEATDDAIPSVVDVARVECDIKRSRRIDVVEDRIDVDFAGIAEARKLVEWRPIEIRSLWFRERVKGIEVGGAVPL